MLRMKSGIKVLCRHVMRKKGMDTVFEARYSGVKLLGHLFDHCFRGETCSRNFSRKKKLFR